MNWLHLIYDIFFLIIIFILLMGIIIPIFICIMERDMKIFDKILVLIIPLFVIMILWNTINYLKTDETQTFTSYIVSLERQSETQWSFVLWFGSVSWVMTYYAYQQLWENDFKLISRSWNSTIKERDNQKPWFYKDVKCEETYLFYKCIVSKYIVVPKWTIKREFNIN